MARKALKPEEIAYIQQSAFSKTDKEIAVHLGRTVETVARKRKQIGILKTNNGTISNLSSIDSQEKNAISVNQSLNEDQRQRFFKAQLTNTNFYNTLKQQFTPNEIDYYLEEWGSLCVQFEDVLATEKRQIDELIKAEIMGNRILRNIKAAEEETQKLIQEVEQYRLDHPKMADSEQEQERDAQLMNLIRIFASQTEGMSQNYQKNVDLKNRILEQLNSRRKDRIDQIKRSNTTFIGIVEKFRDRDVREKEGRHAELIRLSRENKKKKFRETTTFPDGQKDCVLLDEESVVEAEELAVIDPAESVIFDLGDRNNKRVLILDIDKAKTDFITKKFTGGQVDTVKMSKVAKAMIDNTHFDIIFIGENDMVKDLIPHMISTDKTDRTKFIIYGSNEDYIDKTTELFDDKRSCKKVLFEDLVRQMGS